MINKNSDFQIGNKYRCKRTYKAFNGKVYLEADKYYEIIRIVCDSVWDSDSELGIVRFNMQGFEKDLTIYDFFCTVKEDRQIKISHI